MLDLVKSWQGQRGFNIGPIKLSETELHESICTKSVQCGICLECRGARRLNPLNSNVGDGLNGKKNVLARSFNPSRLLAA